MLKRILYFAKNKFVIASVAFLIWMLFFDSNDFSSQLRYRAQRENLEVEKVFYKEEIEKIEKQLEELNSNPQMLEKFARERYLMKKANEDLYIIVEQDQQ